MELEIKERQDGYFYLSDNGRDIVGLETYKEAKALQLAAYNEQIILEQIESN